MSLKLQIKLHNGNLKEPFCQFQQNPRCIQQICGHNIELFNVQVYLNETSTLLNYLEVLISQNNKKGKKTCKDGKIGMSSLTSMSNIHSSMSSTWSHVVPSHFYYLPLIQTINILLVNHTTFKALYPFQHPPNLQNRLLHPPSCNFENLQNALLHQHLVTLKQSLSISLGKKILPHKFVYVKTMITSFKKQKQVAYFSMQTKCCSHHQCSSLPPK